MPSKPLPLTGNHVAKQLRKYLRDAKIPHQSVQTAITIHWPNIKNFPPLTFEFRHPRLIKVWNKLPMAISKVHTLKKTTITKLFEELINRRVITKPQLPL